MLWTQILYLLMVSISLQGWTINAVTAMGGCVPRLPRWPGQPGCVYAVPAQPPLT